MKKLILTTVIMSLASTVSATDGNLTEKQVKVVQKIIQLNGYKCDYVNFALHSNWSEMYDVKCNENKYSYDLKNVEGHWIVTVD